jgi:hypothetical protein
MCLDLAYSAIALSCENPIDRYEYLRVAEEWAVRAYRIERGVQQREADGLHVDHRTH